MGHNHSHEHHGSEKNLKVAFFLNLAFTILEFIGGMYVNSVAIISDAVHDLGDSLSLGTSWYLQRKSRSGANERYSFGYRRFSLLGALINSVILVAGSIYVIYEAINRLFDPQHSDAQGMIIFALIGVVVNGYAAFRLSKGSSLNEKVVSWHLLEDVLGWVAVLIVAIILYFEDNHYLDPALSLLISLYILYNVVRRLRDTLHIFLQGVPAEINLEKIKTELRSLPHVTGVHHIHLWSLEGEHHVFTAHIKLQDIHTTEELKAVKELIRKKLGPYNFDHCTLQTELDDEAEIIQ